MWLLLDTTTLGVVSCSSCLDLSSFDSTTQITFHRSAHEFVTQTLKLLFKVRDVALVEIAHLTGTYI